MNWNYVMAGGISLVLATLAGADYLSTSVSTDGTMMLASSGQNTNGSYASRIMTADESALSRSITGGDQFGIDLSVKGAGPVIVSDTASAHDLVLAHPVACVFLMMIR